MDDIIRDLARSHGHANLSDAQVKELRTKLGNAYLDGLMDKDARTQNTNVSGYDTGSAFTDPAGNSDSHISTHPSASATAVADDDNDVEPVDPGEPTNPGAGVPVR